MAPEFPPSLIIATLRFDDKRLRARLEYVESGSAKPLSVRWSADYPPESYVSVGDGVAFVRNDPDIRFIPITEDAMAIELGNDRYLWKEGLQDGRPRVMFVLVLPPGYTVDDPWPFPTGTKAFHDRIAVYWMLSFYDSEHVDAEWTLKKLDTEIESAVISLNQRFLSRRRPAGTYFTVEDAPQPSIRVIDTERSGTKTPRAFVAMPMNPGDDSLVDVLEAIQAAARRCGIVAERIDEQQSNDRISDRMFEAIRQSKYVIADLTHERPNVFFESGFSHGIGKAPIYVARQGTRVAFDIQDYPVIFFRNMKDLRDKLEQRLATLTSVGKA